MNKKYAYGVCVYQLSQYGIKILLCKSVSSFEKWGTLKGGLNKNETIIQCAKREFEEESSIPINIDFFEEYFEQKNANKDIGVWLYNAKNITNLGKYMNDEKLINTYLSCENSIVKWFNLNHLPIIREKQTKLILEIKGFLENKNQYH